MRKLLAFLVLAIIIGCLGCYCQEESNYQAVYEKGALKVFNQKKDLIDKIKVSATENYRIDQDSFHGLFFYAFYKNTDVMPDFIGLCNTSDGKWIIKLNTTDNKDLLLPNMSFKGSCHHNSYLLFEGGTGAMIREIKVITRKGDQNHSDMYFPNFKEPVWNESRMGFEYYKLVETYPKTLPKFKGNNNAWVRKYIWERGKIKETDEYEQTFML